MENEEVKFIEDNVQRMYPYRINDFDIVEEIMDIINRAKSL